MPKLQTHPSLKPTVQLPDEPGPPLLRQVNGHVVDGHPRQTDTDSYQGVYSVSKQRDDDQEEAAQTVDEGEEQRQLWGEDRGARMSGGLGADQERGGAPSTAWVGRAG